MANHGSSYLTDHGSRFIHEGKKPSHFTFHAKLKAHENIIYHPLAKPYIFFTAYSVWDSLKLKLSNSPLSLMSLLLLLFSRLILWVQALVGLSLAFFASMSSFPSQSSINFWLFIAKYCCNFSASNFFLSFARLFWNQTCMRSSVSLVGSSNFNLSSMWGYLSLA